MPADKSIAGAIARARVLKSQGKNPSYIANFLNEQKYEKLKRDGQEEDWNRHALQRFGIL